MSTRRARIKAVTALPPRRKNGGTKNQQQPKEFETKQMKSPRSFAHYDLDIGAISPRSYSNTNKHNNVKPSGTLQSNIFSPPQSIAPSKEVEIGPITSSNKVEIKNVFASPLSRPNLKRTYASPRRQSPHNVSSTSQNQKTPTYYQSGHNKVPQLIHNSALSEVTQNTSVRNKGDYDFQVPSVSESISDDPMDGIIPLQPALSASKPNEALKSQITSENAEVVFDPIVPLPSPSKLRPKLKPVPRLGPRRNSIQGSASESEDDTRRSLFSGGIATPAPSRQRHDSHTTHTSARSQICLRNYPLGALSPSRATEALATTSPNKEKTSYQRCRRTEVNKRLMTMKRRREALNREVLTMYDLIFFNPSNNPIVPNEDEIKAREEAAKDAQRAQLEKGKEKEREEVIEIEDSDAAPVPQIKLGADGKIILDENSLLINQTSTAKVSSVVREGGWVPTRGQYKRKPRSRDWNSQETIRFYKALAVIGTDFTLMGPCFPDRTRRELKVKFKKEEKSNGALIDKALASGFVWDGESLSEEFALEREEEKKKAEEAKQKLIEEKEAEKQRMRAAKLQKVRRSRASKALEICSVPGFNRRRKNVITSAKEAIEWAKESRPELLEEKFLSQRQPDSTPDANETDAINTTVNNTTPVQDVATVTKITPTKAPSTVTALDKVPTNIEMGSLIVLTVDDPNCPGKKMLQTYIAHEPGKLKQVALPPHLLNTVIGYMKKDTSKSVASSSSSPHFTSPNSVASAESSSTNTSRKRENSFSITQL
ncbi:transcription factor TFIIIB component B'' homolog isoform X1 [Leptidea sinapis]|uniref:transcription factor TFIIIB component B'' homolog isoform X1 n=1 Tax=Leptidea sinapis TaxID=189913 RepID=UPI0021400646|nr:transcription factor TFIIIB component B'' homolog isoform X1 [Leptidea sinapis]